jgi:hypothetical protein
VTDTDDVMAAARLLDDVLRQQQSTADVTAEENNHGAPVEGDSIKPEEDCKRSRWYDDKNDFTCNQSQSGINDMVSGQLKCSKCSDEVVITDSNDGDSNNSLGEDIFMVTDSEASVAMYNTLLVDKNKFTSSQQPEQIECLKNSNINVDDVRVQHNEENDQEAANNPTTKTKTAVVAQPQLEDTENNADYSHSSIQVVPCEDSSNNVCKQEACKPEIDEQKHHHNYIQVIPGDAAIALSPGPVQSEDTSVYTVLCMSPDDGSVYDQLNDVSLTLN